MIVTLDYSDIAFIHHIAEARFQVSRAKNYRQKQEAHGAHLPLELTGVAGEVVFAKAYDVPREEIGFDVHPFDFTVGDVSVEVKASSDPLHPFKVRSSTPFVADIGVQVHVRSNLRSGRVMGWLTRQEFEQMAKPFWEHMGVKPHLLHPPDTLEFG